jgi:hypothetical protein
MVHDWSSTVFSYNIWNVFLISNFRPVLNVVCFILGNSPATEFFMPTFRNTLFHLHSCVGMKYPPMKMEQTKCSETSAYKIQTPGNHPEKMNTKYGIYFKILSIFCLQIYFCYSKTFSIVCIIRILNSLQDMLGELSSSLRLWLLFGND